MIRYVYNYYSINSGPIDFIFESPWRYNNEQTTIS